MIVAIVLSALGTVLLVVGAFAVYQFRKPVAAPLAEGKWRPQADDENQFNSLRSAKSYESRYSGLSVGEGRRSSRIETTNDHEEHPFLGDERPRSYSQPATMERLYDPPATSVSSHGGGHEELDSRPALPPHSFTYPPVASSPTSMSSSSFYRYDPFNPPEPDELSSGSHPPPTSPYTPGKHIRELSFPPPKKALSPVTYEPYSPSSPRTRLVSPTSPRQQTHLRGGSGSYNRP
ncbi:hypothetical protein FRB90_003508 [Tulasnella sp. 427]|nr:hypothetical protein FRB90_003508 [Tulasnella sp. 427]